MAHKRKRVQKVTASKWNTRKLVGFAALFLGSLLLCYTDKATGIETYWFWAWLFGIYIVGNVGAKIVTPAMIGKFKTMLSRRKTTKENK